MRLVVLMIAMGWLVGCSASTDTTVAPPVSVEVETVDNVSASAEEASSVVGSEIALSPDNTLIQFVGTHVGPSPDPNARTGNFSDFQGSVTAADDEVSAISVEIQMASVSTPMDKLTNHLQAPDFFDVRQFPTASFQTTSIVPDEDGKHMITGELTLHGETKEISFPAEISMTDGQLDLMATLTLDRTEFGMTQNTDKVNKEVALTIGVGKHAKSAE